MIVLISAVVVTILVWLTGRIHFAVQFNNQVKTLFAQSENISNLKYHTSQLAGLPDPVQRYFKLVLKENQPYISYMRMTHDGQFKTGLDKNWVNIKGEHYATTEKPGFIWKGTTTMFTARDLYIEDKGQLIVTLFSLVNIVNAKGEHFNQGELLRWLGESILYPTHLLPNDRLQWFAVNDNTAKFTYHYKGLSLFFNITFNQAGEIVAMETKRYMEVDKLETWVIKVSDYKAINDMLIPTAFEVLWRLDKGDFSYAKFYIKKLEYNNPKPF